jgi:hypothetical protein
MWRQVSIAVAASILTGCSASANYHDAEKASAAFHKMMDNGEYAAIYETSSTAFRSLTRDQTIGFFARMNRKMGKCADGTVTLGGYNGTPSGSYVTLNSTRSCANGKLEEQFVWLMVSRKPTLLRYNASNPLLLTD